VRSDTLVYSTNSRLELHKVEPVSVRIAFTSAMSSPHPDAEYWRARARETRAQAEHMSDPETRRELLKIAATYDRLAKLFVGEKS
jgi:hypothetical protein